MRRGGFYTSCFFIRKEAALMASGWGLIDPAVWQACDRIMFRAIQQRTVSHSRTEQKTVFYTSHWSLRFAAMGLLTGPHRVVQLDCYTKSHGSSPMRP